MIRAGVFIGVDKSGDLQQLRDAAAGASRMYQWALEQGMIDLTHARLITDTNGRKVHPDLIYDAISEIINGPGADQLIIYFAGHGVNIRRDEVWLLTDAPVRTSAAVNVSGSVDLARYSGIQHVVFISDACRVAPEGIQAQNVQGVDIFPNDGGSDRAKPVDQFFACLLGRTAAEIKDPVIAAGNYSALYTNALLEALKGAVPSVLEPSGAPNDDSYVVRPRKLESYLEAEIPRRVKSMNLEQKVNQNPDAIITSDDNWISKVNRPVAPPVYRGQVNVVEPARPTLRGVAHDLVRLAAEGDHAKLDQHMARARAGAVTGADQLAATAERIATPFGPDHFETQCGIKVRGARIVDLFAPRANSQLLGGGEMVRVTDLDNPAASIMVRFEGDVGAVIPVFPEFIAALTFDDGELVDVAYEPSANSWRWDMYKDRAEDLRQLRAIAASSSRLGRFRLERDDSFKIAKSMQYAKGIDPTLAVYAAYAYHDLQEVERIREMSQYQQGDVGAAFFDLALLGRRLINKDVGPDDRIVPFFPLLSQGWSLLRAHRFRLHPALDGIENSMLDSLWSLFDAHGLDKIRKAMQSMEVR